MEEQRQGVSLGGETIPPEHDIYSQLVFGQINLNERPLPQDISDQVETTVTVTTQTSFDEDHKVVDSFDVDVVELTKPLDRGQESFEEKNKDNSLIHSEFAPDGYALLQNTSVDAQITPQSEMQPKTGYDILFDLNESLSNDDLNLQQVEATQARAVEINNIRATTQTTSKRGSKRVVATNTVQIDRPRRKCTKRVWNGVEFVANSSEGKSDKSFATKRRRQD